MRIRKSDPRVFHRWSRGDGRGQQTPQHHVVIASDDDAVKRDALHEFEKRAAHVAHVAVAIHVLAVEVCNHGEDRRKLQE